MTRVVRSAPQYPARNVCTHHVDRSWVKRKQHCDVTAMHHLVPSNLMVVRTLLTSLYRTTFSCLNRSVDKRMQCEQCLYLPLHTQLPY
jgi:hypothetical protein